MNSAPLDRYQRIESAANAVVKLMRSLRRKKERHSHGLFLACGAQLIHDAIENGWQVRYGLVADQTSRTVALAAAMSEAGGRVLRVSPTVLASVAGGDGRHGIAAAFAERKPSLKNLDTGKDGRWLALYEARDPGNLGSLLRTAHAALIDGVILIGNSCDPFSSECVRASMGAIFAVPVAHAHEQEFLAWCRGASASLIGAVVDGDRPLDRAQVAAKSVLLLGNERSGVPADLAAACDQRIRIPMRSGFHSLNLAAAGAIMIYALWRQTGYDGTD